MVVAGIMTKTARLAVGVWHAKTVCSFSSCYPGLSEIPKASSHDKINGLENSAVLLFNIIIF